MTNHDAHAHGHGDHPGHGEGDTTGVHGMLLFGEDVVYLSHLPMFMSPHNFQVLLEVGFDDAVHELLRADRDASDGGLHTFEPEVFAITELDPGGDGPARTAIEGTIFHGHFERGGTPIAEHVTAEVRNVVYFAEFDTQARHQADQALTYLCFGRAGQLHLAHRITASPDFDHWRERRGVLLRVGRADRLPRLRRAAHRRRRGLPGAGRARVLKGRPVSRRCRRGG
jgi:hypothetical protein